jgi:hypothetical protein
MLKTKADAKHPTITHVFEGVTHIGTIERQGSRYRAKKDSWPCPVPSNSFSAALSHFRPPAMLFRGYRSSLACLA